MRRVFGLSEGFRICMGHRRSQHWSPRAHEQRHFYANEAKAEVRHFCQKSASRKRSERDRNEIRIGIIRGTCIPGHTRTFLIGVPDVLKHLKDEMHA